MRRGRCLFAALGILAVLWVVILLLGLRIGGDTTPQEPVELVWWSRHMSWDYFEQRQCGIHNCLFTNKRSRLPKVRGVLFYGSNLEAGDFPLPRAGRHVWALLHEESPRNVPFVGHNEFLRHFNFTSTFSRFSSLPLTTQYLPSGEALTSRDYFVPFSEKSAWAYPKPTTVVFLQSDCDTMSGREDYVKELMKYVEVDSYGACLPNKQLPESLKKNYLNNLYSPELMRFLSNYMFMIAIENAACPDYITEKFWRPLAIGIVPIYFGSPTIKHWQPNNKSAIHVTDFAHPRALAAYLLEVAKNKSEYDSYRSHKLNWHTPITNKDLLESLITRPYHIGDNSPQGSLFGKFECAVCEFVASSARETSANVHHYNCPVNPMYVPLEQKKEPKNVADWRSMMKVGQCQAGILDEFFRRNHSYHEAELTAELRRRVEENQCEF